MSGLRALFYALARLLGDINAVKHGTVERRIGRRVVGKLTGRMIGRMFR